MIHCLLFSVSFCFAKTKVVQLTEQQKKVAQILKKYKAAEAVEIKVNKSENKKTLGTNQNTEGVIIFSKGKVNFLTEKPFKTEIIFNKNIWIIEYPDLELDPKGRRKVTILKADKIIFLKKIAQIFSGSESTIKDFEIDNFDEDKINMHLKMTKMENLKHAAVRLNLSKNEISQIKITDDIDTETIFDFNESLFLKKVPTEKLVFKKKKSDEIFKP